MAFSHSCLLPCLCSCIVHHCCCNADQHQDCDQPDNPTWIALWWFSYGNSTPKLLFLRGIFMQLLISLLGSKRKLKQFRLIVIVAVVIFEPHFPEGKNSMDGHLCNVNRRPTGWGSCCWLNTVFSSSCMVPTLCLELSNYLLIISCEGQAKNRKHIATSTQG